jgi:predicted metal-binding membrane protein
VSSTAAHIAPGRDDLRDSWHAVRGRVGLVALLFALAGVAWWTTADRMAGMDGGPGTGLGTLGWFVGVWVVMMAAMMFPSVAPTVALYSRMTRTRRPFAPLLFAGGYLLVWSAAGVIAFGLFALGHSLLGHDLAWSRGGRWAAGAVLGIAALSELTPLKDLCLANCRSPLGFLLSGWRDGAAGSLRMGAGHGGWCLGCCWALMAALFALGVMSLAWMAFVSGVIALEKLLPWRRLATWATAALLLALAIGLVAAPHSVPGLTVPSHGSMGGAMKTMH